MGNRKKGFTLMELLLGVLIFSIISISIGSTLWGGISTWRTLKGTSQNSTCARILFSLLEEEWRNMVLETGAVTENPGLVWETEAGSGIETMTWVFARRSEGKWSLIRIRYKIDPTNKKFFKEQKILVSEDQNDSLAEVTREFPTEIKNFQIRFAKLDPVSPNQFIDPWPSTWEGESGFPKGMKATVSFNNGEEQNKVFWLPLALSK